MFNHILIPTDLSDHARSAINATQQLAQSPEAKVTLLHVIEEIAQAGRDEFQDFYDDIERRSAGKLSELASSFVGSQLQVDQQVVYGNRAREISRFAEQSGVDLIVLASHAVDPTEAGRGWGTLSYKISLLSPCSVLLVK